MHTMVTIALENVMQTATMPPGLFVTAYVSAEPHIILTTDRGIKGTANCLVKIDNAKGVVIL